MSNLERRKRELCRVSLLLLLAFGVTGVLLMNPVPQDPAYHEFAEERTWLGVPRFGDVATNLPFVLIGGTGLWLVARASASRKVFEYPEERAAYAVFFAGTFLTGLGSGWYHLDPGNERLFWDRLPMTMAIMGLFCAAVGERLGPRAGARLLAPLVVLGPASVVWWAWTEHLGQGDLRWYGLAQFYPALAIVLMLALAPSRYTQGEAYWWAVGFYGAAKLAELMDGAIYSAGALMSGHSLKHLLAAAGAGMIFLMLRRRVPLGTPF